MEIKKRDSALDVVRGLAILGVLMIHITSDYAYADGGSLVYGIMNAVNKMFYWAVPSFVTLTVYLALRGGRKLGLVYVVRHACPILGLYLVWSAVYLIFDVAVYGQTPPGLKELILDDLLQGKACYHLYYVVMLVQLYIVIALLSRLPIKKLRPASWMPWAAVILQILVLVIFIRLVIMRFWFYNTAIFPVFYVLPITLGVMLAADDAWTKEYFRRWSPIFGLCAGFATAAAAWFAAESGTFQGLYAGPLFNTGFGAMFNLGAIPLIFLLGEKLRSVRPLEVLGRRSLTVYFAHPLVLYILDRFMDFRSGGTLLLAFGMAVKSGVLIALALGYAYLSQWLGNKK